MSEKSIGIEGVGGDKGSYDVSPDTHDMSLQHHIDTVNYNLRHAEDHLKEARKSCEKLEAAGDNGEQTQPPKSLLDLFDYFEAQVKNPSEDDVTPGEGEPPTEEEAKTMPLDELRKKLPRKGEN